MIFALTLIITLIFSKMDQSVEPQIKLTITKTGEVRTIPLEEYLVGVVLAEMPASFEPEALKAQAVCARSYALRKYFAKETHSDQVAVCDLPEHCQAYVDWKNVPFRKKYTWKIDKVEKAVKQTKGEVLTYNGELIEPSYHSTCGGFTEDSKNVWGSKRQYLQAAYCPWDKDSPYYTKKAIYSNADIEKALGLSILKKPNIEIVALTDSGHVKTMVIQDKPVSGLYFRKQLHLPSSQFTISEKNDCIVITTHGYGHGVGMCQYGANGAAKKGYTYKQVLYHYYHSIQIYRIKY
ncbi:MAG: stage II sporulation protein D [Chitinophagales bacterium]